MPPEITYAYVWVDGCIRVDAAVECGRRFEGIAWIIDPNSQKPLLRLDKPLGTRAVQAILDRAKAGFPIPASPSLPSLPLFLYWLRTCCRVLKFTD